MVEAYANDPASMTSAAGCSAPNPGFRMMRMPVSPSTSMTVRPRFNRSPRIGMASMAVHTGIVNSIAKTVASGSIAIAYTQAYWPPKCSTLRTTCRPKRRVRTAPTPKRGSTASTRANETRLRRNRISKLPMVRSSSRTATAMRENDSSAPHIHRAPRRAAGMPDKPRTDHGFAISLLTVGKLWSDPGFQPRAGKSLRSSRREAP